MSKYTGVNVAGLTLEDALADAEWGKKPGDYLKYVTLDCAIFQSIKDRDFSMETWWEFGLVLTDCVLNGREPDYSKLDSSVKYPLRSTIRDFKERLNSEFLKHYRQYVAAVQRNEGKLSEGDLK